MDFTIFFSKTMIKIEKYLKPLISLNQNCTKKTKYNYQVLLFIIKIIQNNREKIFIVDEKK